MENSIQNFNTDHFDYATENAERDQELGIPEIALVESAPKKKLQWLQQDHKWVGSLVGKAETIFTIEKEDETFAVTSNHFSTKLPTLRGAKIAAARSLNRKPVIA